MDIYPVQVINKFQKLIKFKNIFRNIFLASSSAFAIIIPLAVMNDKLNDILSKPASINILIWFASFIGWILCLFLSTKFGRYIIDLFRNSSDKKRSIGIIILVAWILNFVILGLFLRFNPKADLFISSKVDPIIMATLFILSMLLLPISAFLMRSKIFKVISLLPIFLLVIYSLGIRPHKIKGSSMSPNLINNQYVLDERLSYFFSSPERGDIVIYRLADINGLNDYIARVIALPNEKILIKDGSVYVNDKLLNEPYLEVGTETKGRSDTESNAILIPRGGYFLMGDNRSRSSDSRDYGSILIGNIKAHVYFSYWPKDRVGLIKYKKPALINSF